MSSVKRMAYPEAVFSIKSEMPITTYCKRIASSSFWGGESELLVLVTMLKVPVVVYLPASSGVGYTPLVTYGKEFEVSAKTGQKRKPVKLLFNGVNQSAPRIARGCGGDALST